jgi:hypothetical protein
MYSFYYVMKNAILWDVMPYGSCKTRRFHSHTVLRSMRRLLVTAKVVPGSAILVTLMIKVL